MMTDTTATENLHIAGTASTPTVAFCFDTHQLSLSGESYPENAAAFYGPLMDCLQRYLSALPPAGGSPRVEMHIALTYFNSSSTKMLFGLLNCLAQAAARHVPVALHWYHHPDDDIAETFGQELNMDFPALDFQRHHLE